ncbi:MAG: hypothetical protein GEV03_18410 [Streptosporangiales bacterium]|nr:hypothetical protein [Streptosporangiales bacterium]
MTDDRQRIEDYAAQFERHLAGSAQDRAWTRAELVDHLSDAAEAGELADALRRLGGPEAAAETFARERSMPPAPTAARLLAALIDNFPLVAVAIALFVQGLVRALGQGGGFGATFPPVVHVKIGGVCVALTPLQCGGDFYEGAGLLYAVGVPLALTWSILGLGILEALTGTSPGKRFRGLKVVTESGLRMQVVIGVVRRLSFLAGPLAWLDWIPALWGDRRRVLDLLVGTKVVVAGPGDGKQRGRPTRRSPSS